jgi:hypothetical protein
MPEELNGAQFPEKDARPAPENFAEKQDALPDKSDFHSMEAGVQPGSPEYDGDPKFETAAGEYEDIPYDIYKQIDDRAKILEEQLNLREEAAKAGYIDTEQYLNDLHYAQSRGYATIDECAADTRRQMEIQQSYEQKMAEIENRPGLTDEDRNLLTTATEAAYQARRQLAEADARYRGVRAQEQTQAVEYARSLLGQEVFDDPRLAPIFQATDATILRQFAEGISKHFQRQKEAEIADATARYAATKLKQKQQISPEGRGIGASPAPSAGSGNVRANVSRSFTELIFGHGKTA